MLATGKFKKVRVKPLKTYGSYRGSGSVQVGPNGVVVRGKHVRSLGVRILIGVGLFIGSLIATRGAFAPGGILIYLLVEYVFVERGDTSFGWSVIESFAHDAKRQVVEIETSLPAKHERTLSLKTDQHQVLTEELRRYVPASEVAAAGASKTSAGVLDVPPPPPVG
jgi:hypothetical protein